MKKFRFAGLSEKLYLLLLLAPILFVLTCSELHAYEGQLRKTVDSVLEAYGGREQVEKVMTIAAHGRIDDFLRNVTGGYARTMSRPGSLRIDIMPERGGEVRILSNGKGLQGNGQRLREANPLSLSSMQYQYGYLDLPMSLADNSAKASHKGIKELHGRPMEVLYVELSEAPGLFVYIDLETHLIRRVEAKFEMNGMGSSLLGTEYDDFRIVDGVLFPFRLVNFAGDSNISVISIVRLTINQPLPRNALQTLGE